MTKKYNRKIKCKHCNRIIKYTFKSVYDEYDKVFFTCKCSNIINIKTDKKHNIPVTNAQVKQLLEGKYLTLIDHVVLDFDINEVYSKSYLVPRKLFLS